jgi:hypothetical protein
MSASGRRLRDKKDIFYGRTRPPWFRPRPERRPASSKANTNVPLDSAGGAAQPSTSHADHLAVCPLCLPCYLSARQSDLPLKCGSMSEKHCIGPEILTVLSRVPLLKKTQQRWLRSTPRENDLQLCQLMARASTTTMNLRLFRSAGEFGVAQNQPRDRTNHPWWAT